MRSTSAHLAKAGAVIADHVPVGCPRGLGYGQKLVVGILGVPIRHDHIHQHEDGISAFGHQGILAEGPFTLYLLIGDPALESGRRSEIALFVDERPYPLQAWPLPPRE